MTQNVDLSGGRKMYKKTLLSVSLLFATSALGDTISYNGSIKSTLPDVNVASETRSPISFVKDYALEISPNAGTCNLTVDKGDAAGSMSDTRGYKCLFEWGQGVRGINMDSLRASGVFEQEGDVTLPYSIYVYANGQEFKLLEGAHTVSPEAPRKPVVEKFTASFKDSEKDGKAHSVHNRTERHTQWTMHVEPREFIQTVSLNGKTCSVPIGETTCDFNIKRNFLTDKLPNKGIDEYLSGVTDEKAYFASNQNDLSVSWDFKPPQIITAKVNAKNEASQVINVAGKEFTLAPQEAAAVIKSPHAGSEGTWWEPQTPAMSIFTKRANRQSRIFRFEGQRMSFDIQNLSSNAIDKDLTFKAKTDLGDGYFLYTFDINERPDGLYDILVFAQDNEENGNIRVIEDVLINKAPPDIQALYAGFQLSDTFLPRLDFLGQVTFVAFGGFENDGSRITSIKLNGEEIDSVQVAERGRVALNNTKLLPEDVEIEVIAVDNDGNEASKTYSFDRAERTFSLTGVPRRVIRSVQPVEMIVSRASGAGCTLAQDKGLAQKLAGQRNLGCYVSITEAPLGLAIDPQSRRPIIKGVFNEVGEQTLSYQVSVVDSNGNEYVAFEDAITFNPEEPMPIEINFSDRGINDDGVRIAHVGDGMPTTAVVRGSPAPIMVEYNTNGDITSKEQGASFTMEYNRIGKSFIDKTSDYTVWSTATYGVKAHYKFDESIASEEVAEVLFLPSKRVRVDMEAVTPKELSSLANIGLATEIGQYVFGENGYVYDANTMGDWDVEIKNLRDIEGESVTDSFVINSDEKYNVEFPAAEMFEQNINRFVAVASAKSGIPNMEYRIQSRPVYTKILKGSPVEFTLSKDVISEKVPFRYNIRVQYATRDDLVVADDTIWETSFDEGVTWEAVEGDFAREIRQEVTNASEYLLRAKVNNVVSGEVSYSESIRVIGFEVNDIEIKGPNRALQGQTVVYETELSQQVEDVGQGVYEWSTDKGETWEKGFDTYPLTLTENTELKVRYRLESVSSEIDDEGYSEDSLIIGVDEARPVLLRVEGRELSYEVGTDVEMSATAAITNIGVSANTVLKWTLPDGSVTNTDSIQYTTTQNDLENGRVEIKVEGWIEGFKEQTLKERVISAGVWDYEMPTGRLNKSLNAQQAIAPFTTFYSLVYERVFHPGIEIEFDWIVDESKVTIEQQNESFARLKFNEPGLHEVKVIMSDNRGNSNTYTDYIDVIYAPPMEVSSTRYDSNNVLREPVSLNYRIAADPGHPRDLPKIYRWYVNDELIDGENSFNKIDLKEHGEYDIKVEIESEFGQVGTFTEQVSIAPNIPPICEPAVDNSEASTFITITLNCSDADGIVARRTYKLNDFDETTVSGQIRIRKGSYESIDLMIRAVDDSGDEYTIDMKL